MEFFRKGTKIQINSLKCRFLFDWRRKTLQKIFLLTTQVKRINTFRRVAKQVKKLIHFLRNTIAKIFCQTSGTFTQKMCSKQTVFRENPRKVEFC